MTLAAAAVGATPWPEGRYLQEGRSWPLCACDGPRTAHGTAVLAPGATLLLYSEGLVERRGEDIDRGLDRLAIAARRLHALDVEDLCARLVSELIDGRPLLDDVVVMAVRLPPTAPFGARNGDAGVSRAAVATAGSRASGR